MWDKPNEDWQEDRIYSTIRKYQPDAMIINNTGLNELGKVGHHEIDSVTFERGKPCFVDNTDKYRAGEMCQVLNDHWGYTKNDINYKSVRELVENLIECRSCGCNFLLNTGLKGNGAVNAYDREILTAIGKWIKVNKGFIYNAKPCGIKAENAVILKDDKYYYAVINNMGMKADENVALKSGDIKIKTDKPFKNAIYLDNNEKVEVSDNAMVIKPFEYGNSFVSRVVRFEL